MGAFQLQYSLIVALLLVALLVVPALAQSGCSGDPCLFFTPTATATGTPRPTPGPGTPTAVPMPGASPFPRPFYGIPTSIPNVTYPQVGSPIAVTLPAPPALTPRSTPSPLPMPSPLTMTLPLPNPITNTTPSPLSLPAPLTSTFGLTAPNPVNLNPVTAFSSTNLVDLITPQPLNGSQPFSQSQIITNTNDFVGNAISYTTWLSGEVAALNYTETFTIAVAPAWYAPALPRPMANVGYTFETLQAGIETGHRYHIWTWAAFFGYIVSLPIQLIKAIFDLFRFLGAFGLFVIWLLIMLPVVLFFKILEFLKSLVIKLFNFIIDAIRFILDLIKLIPFL